MRKVSKLKGTTVKADYMKTIRLLFKQLGTTFSKSQRSYYKDFNLKQLEFNWLIYRENDENKKASLGWDLVSISAIFGEYFSENCLVCLHCADERSNFTMLHWKLKHLHNKISSNIQMKEYVFKYFDCKKIKVSKISYRFRFFYI